MNVPQHPRFSRRTALEAGCVSLLGLGLNHLTALRAAGAPAAQRHKPACSVIYIFLSGGLTQHESFDPKPEAPANIRGEFFPIETATPGIHISEHLPLLAARSRNWALVRSLTHPSNDHSNGHAMMLAGRSVVPPTFDPLKPTPGDWPSIAAIAMDQVQQRNNLPPAVVLPDRLIHMTGRVIPGQFSGQMGSRRDPWLIEASPYHHQSYGAYPEYEFHHQTGKIHVPGLVFQAPNLSLPEGLDKDRLSRRVNLLNHVERQKRQLDHLARTENFDRNRQAAISLLTESRVQRAFDVTNADPRILDQYGRNAYGWSLLMAKRLVEAGVALVQVNLGNNETWDTHGNAFPHLKEFLLPPMDRAVSGLLDDLEANGMLDSTLVVMAGEFGRTPKVSHLREHYRLPGRDHWGAVQTVFFAGGGVRGGNVVGSSDAQGGYPASNPQTPENMAASIYSALGIPETAQWNDDLNRPHHIYFGQPIAGLT